MGLRADAAGRVGDDVDLVALGERGERGQDDAHLGPQTRDDELAPPGGLDRLDEVQVLPGVHGGAVDGLLPGEDVRQLRQERAGEGLGGHGAQHDRYVEGPGGSGQTDGGVDDGGAVAPAGAEEHLRLVVHEQHRAVVRGEQVGAGGGGDVGDADHGCPPGSVTPARISAGSLVTLDTPDERRRGSGPPVHGGDSRGAHRGNFRAAAPIRAGSRTVAPGRVRG